MSREAASKLIGNACDHMRTREPLFMGPINRRTINRMRGLVHRVCVSLS